MSVEYDLVIIGGGPAGLVIASAAAQLKAKVVLVENARLGGDCLWSGCVPSKALIEVSRRVYQLKNSQNLGIKTGEIEIDSRAVIAYLNNVIKTIEPNDSPERFQGLGVEVIFGQGEFIDRKTFLIEGRKITARNFAITTGSSPAIPQIKGLTEAGYLTHKEVFLLQEFPSSLAVIGGGPIGCELGQALHRLGIEVTIITDSEQILPKEDPELTEIIEAQFKKEGLNLYKNTKVESIEVKEGKKYLYLSSEKIIIVEEILIATGRQANTERLGLEKAGVAYNNSGITVNNKLQTTNRRIYACGDVIGKYQFTHVAAYQASIVLQNALFFPTKEVDYQVIPWATFTEPEIARVGLTQDQAKEKYGDNIYVLKQPMREIDRAQTADKTDGFMKIIVDKQQNILGAHLVGDNAGELIQEIVLAMSQGLKLSTLKSIHIYPTLAEINSKTAFLLTKEKYAQNKTLQKILSMVFKLLRSLI